MSQLIFFGYVTEMTILADRLRDAMTARNMDQKELADAAGCTQGAISQILVGKTQRSRFLPEIAAALAKLAAKCLFTGGVVAVSDRLAALGRHVVAGAGDLCWLQVVDLAVHECA